MLICLKRVLKQTKVATTIIDFVSSIYFLWYSVIVFSSKKLYHILKWFRNITTSVSSLKSRTDHQFINFICGVMMQEVELLLSDYRLVSPDEQQLLTSPKTSQQIYNQVLFWTNWLHTRNLCVKNYKNLLKWHISSPTMMLNSFLPACSQRTAVCLSPHVWYFISVLVPQWKGAKKVG